MCHSNTQDEDSLIISMPMCHPCGKQHFREIPTPYFVRTLRQQPILGSMLDSYIYLQNTAWVFRGNVVSHMDRHAMRIAIIMLGPMWETTFPRNTHAGFCKDFTTVSYTKWDVGFVHLLTKSAHRPIRFAGRCAISGFVSLGQKNHNMHHRTSTDSIRRSRCLTELVCTKITASDHMHRIASDHMHRIA